MLFKTKNHHLVPISGKLWIGIHPNEKSNILGLSKFHRLTNWIMSRPQIQEEATIALADELETLVQPKGLGIVFKAQHLCCTHRGVKDDSTLMTTSVVRGSLRESMDLKQEFLAFIRNT